VPSELDRALAFEKALGARCAERIIPFRFGRAYFNDSFPQVWDLNYLLVEEAKPLDPGELAAEAELLHTDAGHAHRRVEVVSDAVAVPLERFFRRIGWRIDRELIMAYRGPGDRQADTAGVEEVPDEDLRPLREEIARTEPWATDEQVVQEVLDAGGLQRMEGNARSFTVRADGIPVAAADLYTDGRVAQVEDVATLPAHRGRGYASAIVSRAVEEGLAGGADLVFLVADENDWPKDLYMRLGFETVGRTWSFLRSPAKVAPD
jgi:ribosomal protein S18 acetylase RimI-like enzyme